MGGKLWALVIHITYSNRDIYATSMDENTIKVSYAMNTI